MRVLRVVYVYFTVQIGVYAVSFWLPARVGGLFDTPTVLAGGQLAAAGPAVALSFRWVGGPTREAPTSAVVSVEGS